MLRTATYVLVFALTVSGSTRLSAQGSAPSFDAEVLTFYKYPDGRVISTTAHIFRGRNGETRQETGFGAVITDLKAKSVTLLNFQTREALVFDVSSAPQPPRPTQTPAHIGRTSLEGHPVVKASVRTARGERHEVWTAQDIKAIVLTRVEAPGTTMTQYLRNIIVREPDPTVFAIPDGYSVTRQVPPPGFDPAKSIEFPGQGRGRGVPAGGRAGRGGG